MIIKQKQFKDKWPFTVSEVGIGRIDIEGAGPSFFILHELKCFALSGILESHGFAPLVSSWIWKNGYIPVKKPLSPIFEYLMENVR